MTRSVPPFSGAPEAVFAGGEELHAASAVAASTAAASPARPLVRAFIMDLYFPAMPCLRSLFTMVARAHAQLGTDLIPIPIRSA